MSDFFDYARKFPIRPDTKRPAFAGWQAAATNDPAQLAAWAQQFPSCAWAIACAESQLIGVEIDIKARKVVKDKDSEQVGRERAWAAWKELCASWGFTEPLTPHVISKSGGFHIYFRATGIDVRTLRQRGLVKLPGWQQHVIETRVNGFLLIPPSQIDGQVYARFPNGPTEAYDAPTQLIEALTDKSAQAGSSTPPAAIVKPGSYDMRAFAKYVCKVHHLVGMPREVWRAGIFAMVAQYGRYAAYQIAQAIHDGEPDTSHQIDDLVGRARETFQDGDSTFNTLFKYAHENGILDIVPRSTAAMFGFPAPPLDIDAILAEIDAEGLPAAASPSIAPGPLPYDPGVPAPLPMLARGDKQAELWSPTLASVPHVDRTGEHPLMPDTGHPLRAAINAAIPGIVASGNTDALAVIEAVHPETAAKVGAVTPTVKARAEALRQDAEHALMPNDYTRDHKGAVERDNPDNVRFLLASLNIEIRFNAWLERVELKGWKWPAWTELSDRAVAVLMTRAAQTGTRFTPAVDFIWRTVQALAVENTQDPARDLLDKLEKAWDGHARLHSWLSHACGVPYDAYHQAVSATILLGLVARIRCPGVKFDLMPVFVSERQGTSKSTLARMLALNDDWFVENVALGESAKELVLLLAGKSVAEISEMRTRGEVDAVKAMISATHDEGRPAYGRATVKRPRRNIFVGTTNRLEFLEDPTGGRRFLPIVVQGEINLEWVRLHLAQLVGEAATLQSRGADINLPRGVWALAGEHQLAATAQSSAEMLLREWFEGEAPCWISSANLVLLLRQALGRDVSRGVYAPVMSKLGFKSKPHRDGDGVQRGWVRGVPDTNAPGYGAQLSVTGSPVLQRLLEPPKPESRLPALPY